MPSISQIAEHIGVSKSTVSLALNNKPGVSDEMRNKILEASRELSELEKQVAVPAVSPLAAEGQTGPCSMLILLPQSLHSDEFFTELLQGIQAAAAQYEVQLRMAASDSVLPEDHFIRLLLSSPALRPTAVLAIAAAENHPLFTEVVQLGIPCATIEDQSAETRCSSVGANDVAAGMEAADYLLRLGHRHLAVLGGLPEQAHWRRRTAGIQQALQKAGLELPERCILPGQNPQLAERLLAQCPEVTAAIFINQYSASLQLPVLQARGVRIPQDLSVLTFDETRVAREAHPPLTSVSYPLYQEGFWAVKTLLEKVNQPALSEFRLTFRTTLIERVSCGVPRA